MAKPPAVASKSCCDGLVGCSPAAHVVVIVIQAALYGASVAALGWMGWGVWGCTHINGNSRILKWRYCTIYGHILRVYPLT